MFQWLNTLMKDKNHDGRQDPVPDADGANTGLRPEFWKRYPMQELTRKEWEALCDGCGLCCLFKFAEDDQVSYTSVACRLLDHQTCRCKHYERRTDIVKDCVVLDYQTLLEVNSWLPTSCAYKRVFNGEGLAEWHHLVSGSHDTVHEAGISVRGRIIDEHDIDMDDLEDHVMELPKQ